MPPDKTVEELVENLTIEQIEKAINDVYLLVDKGIIRIILATVIGNRLGLSDQPIWLLIIAGSGGGKSLLVDLISKCGSWICPVDTITSNTFASGLKRDEEVSLLYKANNGVIVCKDWTGIMNLQEPVLIDIMGQLRNIFDGTFVKRTGNNADVIWKGKIGLLAAGTVASQRKLRQFSEQGERMINYVMNLADSKEMAKRALRNRKGSKQTAEDLADMVAKFVNQKINQVQTRTSLVSDEIEDEIIAVADFATLARSPVTMDKRDSSVVLFVGDREVPTRVAVMLTNIAFALMLISNEETLSKENANIIFKIALDSVPVERRIVLSILAKYKKATTKAIATHLHYPTVTVRAWLSQVNALKLVKRESAGGKGSGNSDSWTLKREYKDVMLKYENIKEEEGELEEKEDSYEIENAYVKANDLDDDENLKGAVFSLNEAFPNKTPEQLEF